MNIISISPLEKPFLTDQISSLAPLQPYPVMRGETFSFHIAASIDASDSGAPYLKQRCRARVEIRNKNGTAAASCRLYSIISVPVRTAAYPNSYDDDYISVAPGLYPDLLVPVTEESELYIPTAQTALFRLEALLPQDSPAGEYNIDVIFSSLETGEELGRASAVMVQLDASLPPQKTVVMQWLHADCLAERYKVKALSDEHFEIIENYVRCAVENGVNALYTPIFTPPLDTEVGGERLTVQLVDVALYDGKWSFGYAMLDRFIDMALRCGVEYFEISHLFTQWGAGHAPKIIAETEDGPRRVFGWDTDASGEDYRGFLRALLPSLRAHMRERGLEDKCIFHVSDEPSEEQKGSYRSAAESVKDLLDGCVVADAMSEESFFTEGICSRPIAGTSVAERFLTHIPEGLWVYYCCSQSVNVSNRFIAMPAGRERIIGVQMWKARASGFLHWGYNFWMSQYSTHKIDPFLCTDGDYFSPAGDAFSVYPGDDGSPLMSVRLRTFYEALCDIRALSAAEAAHGRDDVEKVVDEVFGADLSFSNYPHGDTGDRLLSLRRRLAEM